MSEGAIGYVRGSDDPDARLTLYDDDGTIVPLSGATFEVKVGKKNQTAEFTKTTGITGGDVSPNCVIHWDITGELNTLPASPTWTVQIKATITGRDRYWQIPLEIQEQVL
jgi:hypothetical protein